MSWKVVAYYTNDEVYRNHAKNFVDSVQKLGLSYDVTSIDSSGDWFKGMQYKPVFLKQMLKKHSPYSLVYVDIDAIFCRYPTFFDILDKREDVYIAAHILNHSKYGRRDHSPELLSGTIFLKNNERASIIISDWIEECKKSPRLWDQRALANVLRENDLIILPEEYCVIFDYMSVVKDPVIKHFQASRKMRKNMESAPTKRVKVRISNSRLHVKRVPGSLQLRTKKRV